MYSHWLYGNLKSFPLGDKWGGPTSNESLTQVTHISSWFTVQL